MFSLCLISLLHHQVTNTNKHILKTHTHTLTTQTQHPKHIQLHGRKIRWQIRTAARALCGCVFVCLPWANEALTDLEYLAVTTGMLLIVGALELYGSLQAKQRGWFTSPKLDHLTTAELAGRNSHHHEVTPEHGDVHHHGATHGSQDLRQRSVTDSKTPKPTTPTPTSTTQLEEPIMPIDAKRKEEEETQQQQQHESQIRKFSQSSRSRDPERASLLVEKQPNVEESDLRDEETLTNEQDTILEEGQEVDTSEMGGINDM